MSINRRRLSLTIITGLCVEAINKVSPLLILHHAQKYLGLAAFGWAQYGVALLETLQPLVAFGYTNYALAEVSRATDAFARSRQLYSRIGTLKGLHALILLLGCLIWSMLQPGATHIRDSFGLLMLMLFSTACDAMWYGMVRQKLAPLTMIGGLARVAGLIAILVLVRGEADKHLFMTLMVLPNALIALTTGFYAFRQLRWSQIVPAQLREVLVGSTPYALIAIILTFYDRYDLFLVERWFGLESAGAYAGPAKVVQSLIMMTAPVVMAFYAEMVRMQDRESLFRHAALSLWCLMVIATPMTFGAPFVENEIMRLLFANNPPEAHGLFSILALGMIGNMLIAVFGLQILQVKGQPWKLIQALMMGLLVGPLLAWLLRDRLGLQAAAWAVVSSKTCAAALAMWSVRPVIGGIPWSSLTRTLLAGFAMVGVLLLIRPLGLINHLVFGGATYLVALIILNRQQVQQALHHPKILRYWRKGAP